MKNPHIIEDGEQSWRIESNDQNSPLAVIVQVVANEKVSMLHLTLDDHGDDMFLTTDEQIALRDILNHLHPIDSTPQI